MRRFDETFRVLGPAAAVILGGFLGAVGASIAAMVTRLRARADRPIVPALLPALGCLAVIALGGILATDSGRDLVAQSIVPSAADPAGRATQIALGIERQLEGIRLAALSLQWATALVAGFAAVIVIRAAQRRGQPWAPPALATGALALPVILFALGAGRYVSQVRSFELMAGLRPESKAELLAEILAESRAGLLAFRVAVLGAAGVGGVALAAAAWWAGARKQAAAPSSLAAAGILFVVGLGAFVATRAEGADAALPVEASRGLAAGASGPVPLLERCPDAEAWPQVILRDGVLRLEWRAVPPEDLAQELARRRKLSVQGDSLSRAALLVAPADAPASALAPALRALLDSRRPEMRQLALAARRPHPLETRTLGRVGLEAACGIPFTLDAAGVPLARYPTVADLARALTASPTPAAIAP